MRTVELKLRFAFGHLTIRKYDSFELWSLVKSLEEWCNCGTPKSHDEIIKSVEQMIPKIFPNFSDDDILDFTEKMNEEIEGIEGGHIIERKLNHLVSDDMQMLLFWYRLREALHVNWKHLQEIADQRYQDAVKGGLFDCDDITFESEEALSQKGEL